VLSLSSFDSVAADRVEPRFVGMIVITSFGQSNNGSRRTNCRDRTIIIKLPFSLFCIQFYGSIFSNPCLLLLLQRKACALRTAVEVFLSAFRKVRGEGRVLLR